MKPEAALEPSLVVDVKELCTEALEELVNPPKGIPLSWWPTLQSYFGGFRPKEYTIFCGSTGSGKTAFLANLSAQLIEQGEKHFVMSVENGANDFIRRVASVFAGRDLNTGDQVQGEDLEALMNQAIPRLIKGMLYLSLYENRVSVEQLMKDLRVAREMYGCRVAFIDNLNFFMEVGRAHDMVYEMDRVTHELIVFCKQIDMHIVMVMHPKKNANPRDVRVESEFEIKGSSTAVQEAHNIFLFNRAKADDIPNVRKASDRELIIAKMRRRGAHVGRSVWMKFEGGRYSEHGNQSKFAMPPQAPAKFQGRPAFKPPTINWSE